MQASTIEPVIQARDLTRVYPGAVPVRAVDGVDLDIMAGEFTTLVGPSGSGKTTLLNLIGGLDKPTSGIIRVGGKVLTGLSEPKRVEFRLRHIGFVFQSYNLIPVLSARENVEFVLLLQGMGKAEREKRALELLEAVGLSRRPDARPGQLSGGQQQRVAVARALASHPDFVLADEPTANLDSASAFQLLDVMRDLNHSRGITFLFSTHDARVMERAGRIIHLEDGKIARDEVRSG